ncbi:MAG TPA: 3-hydroxyacyl-CoA dehydrogenase NAD-binding domain-containing protein, partial [Beijerinckiaceae bacterium]|nr:3-hydroxyacyl-CoA dehydrogenase NAD-binding domain-containing protein [Beijerinckiaceae bacterium]
MRTIAVIGAGIMGHGLALVFALGGHRVRITDASAETLARVP